MHRLSAAIIVRRRDAALTVVRLPDAKFVCRQLSRGWVALSLTSWLCVDLAILKAKAPCTQRMGATWRTVEKIVCASEGRLGPR
jgi:hypothetical protein